MTPNDLLNLELKAKSSGLDWHDFLALKNHYQHELSRVDIVIADDMNYFKAENERLEEENDDLEREIGDLVAVIKRLEQENDSLAGHLKEQEITIEQLRTDLANETFR